MENIEAMLCAFIEGDLDEGGRAQIEKHLEKNPQHRKLLEEMTAMRDMVKALPRVKAPVDVGDSLRQKVERSMLFDDTAAVAPARERVNRLPQFLAIAAIFMLITSLCVILFRALSPTMKPVTFTPMAVNQPPAMQETSAMNAAKLSDQVASPPNVQMLAPAGANANVSTDGLNSAPIAPAAVPPQNLALNGQRDAVQNSPVGATGAAAGTPIYSLQNVQQFAARAQNQTVALAQVDLDALRLRLQKSGYAAAADKNAKTNLVVVNSSNPPATVEQINQFMNSNSGVWWAAVPEDVASTKIEPAQREIALGGGAFGGAGAPGGSAGIGSGGGGGGMPAAVAPAGSIAAPIYLDKNPKDAAKNVIPATQPASDVYVAHGLTVEQVDALRQTLTLPQNGTDVEVRVQLAQNFATTQPSEAEGNGLSLATVNFSGATSQPSEANANAAADLSANVAQERTTTGNNQTADNRVTGGNPVAGPLDTVIVLQRTANAMLVPAATQPDTTTPVAMPPATQPTTQP